MSKTKQGNFRSKSKGPSKAATISRHQLVYKMARKAANQDLIDLGCMKTIEEVKAEKAIKNSMKKQQSFDSKKEEKKKQ